jgi:hypothetical protein
LTFSRRLRALSWVNIAAAPVSSPITCGAAGGAARGWRR